MSDERGWAYKNRKKIGVGFAVAGFLGLVGVLSWAGWIPSLGFLFKPLMIAFYGVSAVAILLAYTMYRASKGESTPFIGGATTVEQQLSSYQAKELIEFALFQEDDPIMVGEDKRREVVPVTNQGEGTSIRVLEWVFKERNGDETYAVHMDLDQNLEFQVEWVENLTPENLENCKEAIRSINNLAITKKSETDNFQERIEEKREQIGQSSRMRNVIEHFDEETGEVKKRVKRNVMTVPNSEIQTQAVEQEQN